MTDETLKLAREQAELFYDLFRSAPIPSVVNGEVGRAAFFGRHSQVAYSADMLKRYAEQVARDCAEIAEQKYADPAWNNHYLIAASAIASAIRRKYGVSDGEAGRPR